MEGSYLMMKVLAVVPSVHNVSPGQRYRIEQWEPHLQSLGTKITFLPFETNELRTVLYTSGNIVGKMAAVAKGLRRRSSDLKNVSDFDLVYVFREAALLGPAWFERKIAATGVPMVFDFDDAVFVPYRSPSNGYLSYLKFPQKTETIIRLSAHVMAGNAYLADYSKRFNSNVTIVPTTIDTTSYVEQRNGTQSDIPVIGWSGSHSTVQHLDTIRGALQELATRKRFKLRVIGAPSFELPGVETEVLEWRSETEIEDLSQIDIGLMPLPDDAWSKGKCGLKALQYMALGKATICSPVGVNSEIISEGVNGMLADDKSVWVEKLSTLLSDSSLRKRLGSEARKTVVKRYSAEVHAPRVFEIFKRVIENKRQAKNGNS